MSACPMESRRDPCGMLYRKGLCYRHYFEVYEPVETMGAASRKPVPGTLMLKPIRPDHRARAVAASIAARRNRE